MHPYNFDELPDRRGTASIKHELTEKYFGRPGLLPFWVADMDFETPDFVRQAVMKRAMHPVYGYTFRDERFTDAIVGWMKRRHGYDVEKEWIVFTPGIVPALNLGVLATTNPGDAVIVQPPVYFPFFRAVTDHGRVLIHNILDRQEGAYRMNFDQLEQQAAQARLLMLCNPHNPVGRCWTRQELEQVGRICEAYKLTVISDEIHSDLVLPGYQHTVFAGLGKYAAERTITLHAPSKTFNLAGLSTAFAIIPNEDLRKNFEAWIDKLHIGLGNIFGIEALIAAFGQGDRWLDALLRYLADNARFARDFLTQRMPELKVYPLEATYLLWLDFSQYGLNDSDLHNLLTEKAGVALSRGSDFGPRGENCMRLNVACPRSMLQEGLERMAAQF
ncbi:MAG: putative C-S lyase [Bacteroidetes bacterium]|nr:putative C-S lyase [Bacteroidota bacterium]